MKSCTYRCISCGERFHAASPEMSLLVSGQLVEHCGRRAVVVREQDKHRHGALHNALHGRILELSVKPCATGDADLKK